MAGRDEHLESGAQPNQPSYAHHPCRLINEGISNGGYGTLCRELDYVAGLTQHTPGATGKTPEIVGWLASATRRRCGRHEET